jgi:hypothetical protein
LPLGAGLSKTDTPLTTPETEQQLESTQLEGGHTVDRGQRRGYEKATSQQSRK